MHRDFVRFNLKKKDYLHTSQELDQEKKGKSEDHLSD